MITGSPTPISGLPTGTIDNLNAVFPLNIGMPDLPQTIQASLSQLAQILETQFQLSGTSGGDAEYLSTGSPTIFTSSGTWSKPAGLAYIIVEVVGGGGGGGGVTGAVGQTAAGSPGAGGGYAKKKIMAAGLGATEAITVGAAGTGGAAGNNAGTNGGSTSFGSHVSATGGEGGGGQAASSTVPRIGSITANPGDGSGGDINVRGENGLRAIMLSATVGLGSKGGDAFYGKGGIQRPNQGNGSNASGYGAGGSGGLSLNTATDQAGGNGSGGLCIIWEYLSG